MEFAAEVKNLNSENFIEAARIKRWDRHSLEDCSKQAFNDSGLEINESNASRIGVIIGSGVEFTNNGKSSQILSQKDQKG